MKSIFEVVTLVWSLQGGQYFNNAILDNNEFSTNNNYFLESSFEFQFPLSFIKLDVNNIFIGSKYENQFTNSNDIYFKPWQDTYKVNFGIRFIGIEIGFEHICSHPVFPNNNNEISKINYSYDKLYGKVSGNF